MPPLPLRVRPRAGESPTSLLCRLASRSGFQSVEEFAKFLGMNLPALEQGRRNQDLAELSKIPLDLLNEWSAVRSDAGTMTYRGETLLVRYDWVVPRKRAMGGSYCPCCLRCDLEDSEEADGFGQRAYWRSWWDVTSVRVCERHHRLLIQNCPNDRCGAAVGLRGGSLHMCQDCGADLTDGRASSLLAGVGTFQRYVHGRLGLAHRVPVPEIDRMPICHAEEICWRLGMAERRTSLASADHAKQAPIEFMSACDTGFELVRGGETAIEHMLDRLAANASGHIGGPVKAYGNLYHWLVSERVQASPHVDTLRGIVERHALREVPFMLDDRLFGQPVRENVYISIRAAATSANLQYKSFVSNTRELGLLNEKDLGLRRFRRSNLAVLEDERGQPRTTQKEFIELFGISLKSLTMLGAASLLPPLEDPSRPARGFARSEVEQMFDRIGMNIVPCEPDADHLRLDDPQVNRFRALEALLRGRIRSLGPSVAGDPKTLILRRTDLETARAVKRSAPHGSRREPTVHVPIEIPCGDAHLSLKELGAALGCGLPLVREIVAARLVSVEIVRKTGERRISSASARRFVAGFVFAATLYETYGVSWGDRLREALVAEGMDVIRFAGHPKRDLLRSEQVDIYLPLMRKLRNDWHCDYHRDRARTVAAKRDGRLPPTP